LLNVARSLIEEGGQSADMTIARRRFSLAVIVAHTACEIATERRLFELLAAKGTQYLEDWVRSALSGGYNLSNDRVRGLYTTLTGDEVQKDQPFWKDFTDSVKRRNDIVHRGNVVEKVHAEESYKTANDLLARLNVVC
jgi:hypothetical protein